MMYLNLEEIKKHKDIKKIIEKHDIKDNVIEQNLNIINKYLNEFVNCKDQAPLSECNQIIKGIQTVLSYKNNLFYITSKYCNHWLYENQNISLTKNILFADYDKFENTLTIEQYLKTLDLNKIDSSEQKLIKAINKLSKNPEDFKGIYLYGEPGIGKTYYMKLLANTYAKKDKKVVFVTTNKLITIIKETFNNSYGNDYNKLFNLCCTVDVLILDDIGAEIVSDWSRDEVLFGILNTRLEQKKKTFFTSNFSINDLQEFYINKKVIIDKLKFEKMKTLRFTERIKALAYPIELIGKNKRY